MEANSESPPIAGFGGIAGTQGLTTQTLYDADLTDNVGLEATTGISVTNPLGGTYNVSLAGAVPKLGQPIARGGAGIFQANIVKMAPWTATIGSGIQSSERQLESGQGRCPCLPPEHREVPW